MKENNNVMHTFSSSFSSFFLSSASISSTCCSTPLIVLRIFCESEICSVPAGKPSRVLMSCAQVFEWKWRDECAIVLRGLWRDGLWSGAFLQWTVLALSFWKDLSSPRPRAHPSSLRLHSGSPPSGRRAHPSRLSRSKDFCVIWFVFHQKYFFIVWLVLPWYLFADASLNTKTSEHIDWWSPVDLKTKRDDKLTWNKLSFVCSIFSKKRCFPFKGKNTV